jgi:hypothetical protein
MGESPKVKNYIGLIAQKAWSAWRKLPPQPRHWIDVEDLIQDGVLYTKAKVIPKYRPHRANFTTFLAMCLEQYYSRMLHEHFTMKRNAMLTVPLDLVAYRLAEQDEFEDEIEAVETLRKLSRAASPGLKHYLKHWLLLKGHIHFRGDRFRDAKKEMQTLCNQYGFSRKDMEFLLYHESWRRGVDLHLDS